MSRLVFATFLLLSFALMLCAQGGSENHGLKVSGSVIKIDSKCINGKPVPQITVYIQFRNESDVPILLLMYPQRPFFELRVRFESEDFAATRSNGVLGDVPAYNPYLKNPFGSPTDEDYDPVPYFMAWFIKTLKSSTEPLKQIDSGGYYEFQDVFWVKNGFEINAKTANAKGECEPSKKPPIPKYSFFTVEYNFSIRKYDDGTDLLKTLQTRWKSFGHFPLDGNGDISYKSERIFLNIGNK